MDVIQTAEQASTYLEGLINFERDPGTARARMTLHPIQRLLDRLDNPERALSIVHVAGSKGKGSTCLFAENVLRATGERVGTFTSPHLQSWNERFRVEGACVPGELLAAAVQHLRPHVESLRCDHPDDPPTFFDATTAAALWIFAREAVDRVLLEVGLGGRLDSTNAVSPAVCCITSIELEHTDKLGETAAEIAGEKAGILKSGVPCVVGRLPAEASKVVRDRARAVGAPLFEWGVDFEVDSETEADGSTRVRYAEADGYAVDLRLRVLGAHQAQNAALALASVRQLGVHGDEALRSAAREGLGKAVLPGRVEVMGRNPWLVVDSAHTAASARALADALPTVSRERTQLVLSVSAGKDLDSILDALLPLAGCVTVTRADARRSISPEDVAATVRRRFPESELRVVPNPHLAVRAAWAAVPQDGLLCAAGSIYLAGIAREILGAKSAAPVGLSRRGSLGGFAGPGR